MIKVLAVVVVLGATTERCSWTIGGSAEPDSARGGAAGEADAGLDGSAVVEIDTTEIVRSVLTTTPLPDGRIKHSDGSVETATRLADGATEWLRVGPGPKRRRGLRGPNGDEAWSEFDRDGDGVPEQRMEWSVTDEGRATLVLSRTSGGPEYDFKELVVVLNHPEEGRELRRAEYRRRPDGTWSTELDRHEPRHVKETRSSSPATSRCTEAQKREIADALRRALKAARCLDGDGANAERIEALLDAIQRRGIKPLCDPGSTGVGGHTMACDSFPSGPPLQYTIDPAGHPPSGSASARDSFTSTTLHELAHLACLSTSNNLDHNDPNADKTHDQVYACTKHCMCDDVLSNRDVNTACAVCRRSGSLAARRTCGVVTSTEESGDCVNGVGTLPPYEGEFDCMLGSSAWGTDANNDVPLTTPSERCLVAARQFSDGSLDPITFDSYAVCTLECSNMFASMEDAVRAFDEAPPSERGFNWGWYNNDRVCGIHLNNHATQFPELQAFAPEANTCESERSCRQM